eukprot:TRINITY_DN389_c0_g1_i1.p1 TRINITY_DN389_c0_g1~~TRINITY_DN389_c0_g1_i1.p1  ORF type:complete len:472 (+),score=88.46 TRINITY_DN389_c0_g1_i1:117-1532(+)
MQPPEVGSVAVGRLRELIRFRTVCGEGATNGAYRQAADWLSKWCLELGLHVKEVSPVPGKPIVIATIVGTDPTLPSILLNSHYDVVPADREKWTCDPFAAEIHNGYVVAESASDADAAHRGKGGSCVFGRGAQDMKCVCVQYIEALQRLLAKDGWKPRRTCHLTFVPDEEIGGADGMAKFLQTKEFEELQPIALALDEGLANPRNAYTVFYGERSPWWLLIRAKGNTGHGSRFIQATAVEKLMGVVNKALAFRKEQEKCLGWGGHEGCKHGQARKLGDVTTLNVTMLKTGVSVDGGKTYSLNVVPSEAEAGFDVRISPSLATSEFKCMLDAWCAEEGLSWSFAPWTKPLHDHLVTPTDPGSNPFYALFEAACEATGKKVEREIFPAATDSRFLRLMGIRALGFSPMPNSPVLLHEHNEALSVEAFLDGIETYCKVLEALLGAPRQADEDQATGNVDEQDQPPVKKARSGET